MDLNPDPDYTPAIFLPLIVRFVEFESILLGFLFRFLGRKMPNRKIWSVVSARLTTGSQVVGQV